jgi:hypothetical protein
VSPACFQKYQQSWGSEKVPNRMSTLAGQTAPLSHRETAIALHPSFAPSSGWFKPRDFRSLEILRAINPLDFTARWPSKTHLTNNRVNGGVCPKLVFYTSIFLLPSSLKLLFVGRHDWSPMPLSVRKNLTVENTQLRVSTFSLGSIAMPVLSFDPLRN